MKLIRSTVHAIACSAVVTTGCASLKVNLNIGEIDYAVAETQTGKLLPKYTLPGDADQRVIGPGDSISIMLQQLFIRDFSERFERVMASVGLTKVRGEIAVVAKVFEMSDGATMGYGDSHGKKGGRLIFYSEDVRSGGQFLNESSVPLYGPIEYKGNPIAFQLSVLELDNAEAAQIKGLLSTIAKLGSKAYAPASPVLSALDAIGSELLSGEQDDIEFQYAFYLYPQGGSDLVQTPRILVGDHVFVRQEPTWKVPHRGHRGYAPLAWTDYCFDRETGRVRVIAETSNAPTSCPTTLLEYRERTWAVLHVQRGFPSIGLDIAQSFAEFESKVTDVRKLDEFESKFSAALDDFQAKVKERKEKGQRDRAIGGALDLIATIPDNKGQARELLVAKLFDFLKSRGGFPTGPDGAALAFSPEERVRLIGALRSAARSVFDVSGDFLDSLTSASDLSELLQAKE